MIAPLFGDLITQRTYPSSQVARVCNSPLPILFRQTARAFRPERWWEFLTTGTSVLEVYYESCGRWEAFLFRLFPRRLLRFGWWFLLSTVSSSVNPVKPLVALFSQDSPMHSSNWSRLWGRSPSKGVSRLIMGRSEMISSVGRSSLVESMVL